METDFDLPPDTQYPDDRVLVIVTFRGRRITPRLLSELSRLVSEHSPAYHIFIDGQVSHGKSFEIVLCPSGDILGSESAGAGFLVSLGFPTSRAKRRFGIK